MSPSSLPKARGDRLEIEGTISDGQDAGRLKAILRSMPLLRDFHLDATFRPE